MTTIKVPDLPELVDTPAAHELIRLREQGKVFPATKLLEKSSTETERGPATDNVKKDLADS